MCVMWVDGCGCVGVDVWGLGAWWYSDEDFALPRAHMNRFCLETLQSE